MKHIAKSKLELYQSIIRRFVAGIPLPQHVITMWDFDLFFQMPSGSSMEHHDIVLGLNDELEKIRSHK